MADAALGVKRASMALGSSVPPRTCLEQVRTWLGAPGGPPTAAAAWLAARGKHTGDPAPPPGVPVFFAPNHVALSIGGGGIISTDWPRLGTVGQTTITTLSRAWHHPYLGWTSTIDGAPIHGIGGHAAQLAVSNAGFHIPNPFGPGNPLLPWGNNLTIPKGLSAPWQAFSGFVSLLSDPFTYIRLAMFGVGVTLVFLAIHNFDAVKSATSQASGAVSRAVMEG